MAIEFWVLAREITITTGTNDVIKFDEDGGAPATATLAAGTYYLNGTGDADDILAAIVTAMDAGGGNSYTFAYQAKYDTDAYNCHSVLSTNGTSVKLVASGTTFDWAEVGMPIVDTTYVPTQTSSVSSKANWSSSQPVVADDLRTSVAGVELFKTSQNQRYTFEHSNVEELFDLPVSLIEQSRMFDFAATADPYRALQSFWENARAAKRIKAYKTTASDTTKLTTLTSGDLVGTYVMDGETVATFAAERDYDGTLLYGITLSLAPYVA